jgi:hypothetical protein
LFIEYYKLKRLNKFYLTYNELGERYKIFSKVIWLAKKECLGVEQIIRLLQLADEDNPFGLSSVEQQRKGRIDEIHELDMQIER